MTKKMTPRLAKPSDDFIKQLNDINLPDGEIKEAAKADTRKTCGVELLLNALARLIEQYETLEPEQDQKVVALLLGDESINHPPLYQLIKNAANQQEGASADLAENLQTGVMQDLQEVMKRIKKNRGLMDNKGTDSGSDENTLDEYIRTAAADFDLTSPQTPDDRYFERAALNVFDNESSPILDQREADELYHDANDEHREQSRDQELKSYLKLYDKLVEVYDKTIGMALTNQQKDRTRSLGE